MIHECFRDGFVCCQAFAQDVLRLEAQFVLELHPKATWTGEIWTEVNFCPFCGFKYKSYEEKHSLEKNSKGLPEV